MFPSKMSLNKTSYRLRNIMHEAQAKPTIASMSADMAAATSSPEAMERPLETAAKLTEPPMYDAARAETTCCKDWTSFRASKFR